MYILCFIKTTWNLIIYILLQCNETVYVPRTNRNVEFYKNSSDDFLCYGKSNFIEKILL